jgi:hypothetical protein
LGLVIPIAALFDFLKPASESTSIWFQRSGSLAVFVAVCVEYNLFKLGSNIILTGLVKPSEKHPTEALTPAYRALHVASAILAVTGTIIWGYGDLFVSRT